MATKKTEEELTSDFDAITKPPAEPTVELKMI